MRWLRFILSHSIFISFCASALGAQAFILYREQINFSACILLFFLTLGSYNLYWILSKLSFGRRSVILKGSYANIFLGLISVVGAAFILWEHPSFVPHLVIPVTLTIAYSLPLWTGKIFENLRKAGFMKLNGTVTGLSA